MAFRKRYGASCALVLLDWVDDYTGWKECKATPGLTPAFVSVNASGRQTVVLSVQESYS